LSVALGPARWLNVEGQLPSPIFWAWPSTVSTAITAVAVLIAAGFAVRRITRPLRRLADAADRLGRGEDVPPLPEEGPEEARRTTHAFNAMQARVRRFVADRTRMIAAMSHDLRTPLTSLRLRAEFVDDDETREKMIATIDEMSRMTEATLAFARDDAKDEAARRTDVAALVRAIVDDFADMGADVVAEGPDRLDMTVRPSALRRALRNLVENALRYGVRARVTLARETRETVITVDDDGPGIAADRIDEVFEPFTRLETSRNAETGGVGLGLSTARSIVRAHGGEITLTNREGGGLTATVRLPV
ncbi:ATP-binding protein, partial [Oharaeibacter diazotrophicus]